MTCLGQKEFESKTETILEELERFRGEHDTILNRLQDYGANDSPHEKLDLLQKSLEQAELGISEAHIMLALASHLQTVEEEKLKLKSQIKSFRQKNALLREELGPTQHKLHVSETQVAQLEESINHLKFLSLIKKYDVDIHPGSEALRLETKVNKSVADGEKVTMSANASPTSPSQIAQLISAGYEIPARLRTLHGLVIQYASEGRYEVAEPLCRQVLEDLEKTSGHDHPDVAMMLNILALVYRDQNKYKEAANLLNDALEIREKTLGVNHPAVAATLNNLAVLFGKRGKYLEAETYCKRALSIREKDVGSDHPDVAKQLNNLALLCQNRIAQDERKEVPKDEIRGKYEEVEKYYQRALEIYDNKLDSDDPIIAKTKNNLASAYLRQGKYKEAEHLCKQILNQVHEKEFGDDSDGQSQPIWKVAEEREANKHNIAKDGPSSDVNSTTELQKHPRGVTSIVTTTLKNLATAYRQQSKYEAADTLEDCSMRIENELHPLFHSHPSTFAATPEVLKEDKKHSGIRKILNAFF